MCPVEQADGSRAPSRESVHAASMPVPPEVAVCHLNAGPGVSEETATLPATGKGRHAPSGSQ